MPFKSEAQRRKFGEMVKQGKMSQATFDEWNKDTPKKIPDRVKKGSTKIKEIEVVGKKHKSVDSITAYRKKKYGF